MPVERQDTTSSGDFSAPAIASLVPVVYEELRRIARRQLRSERAGHTLSTSALVNEAYLKLADQTRAEWRDHAHFLAVAAQAMRRVLVDHARRHRAAKRGGDRVRVTLESGLIGAGSERADALLALDDALSRLAQLDERQSRVVECRFFAGMTEDETARVLGVTARTVRRDWVKAKGWLYREIRDHLA